MPPLKCTKGRAQGGRHHHSRHHHWRLNVAPARVSELGHSQIGRQRRVIDGKLVDNGLFLESRQRLFCLVARDCNVTVTIGLGLEWVVSAISNQSRTYARMYRTHARTAPLQSVSGWQSCFKGENDKRTWTHACLFSASRKPVLMHACSWHHANQYCPSATPHFQTKPHLVVKPYETAADEIEQSCGFTCPSHCTLQFNNHVLTGLQACLVACRTHHATHSSPARRARQRIAHYYRARDCTCPQPEPKRPHWCSGGGRAHSRHGAARGSPARLQGEYIEPYVSIARRRFSKATSVSSHSVNAQGFLPQHPPNGFRTRFACTHTLNAAAGLIPP
jgi:hypothetical protein